MKHLKNQNLRIYFKSNKEYYEYILSLKYFTLNHRSGGICLFVSEFEKTQYLLPLSFIIPISYKQKIELES